MISHSVRVGDRADSSVAYGFLPPRFFAEVRRRFLALEAAARSTRLPATKRLVHLNKAAATTASVPVAVLSGTPHFCRHRQ